MLFASSFVLLAQDVLSCILLLLISVVVLLTVTFHVWVSSFLVFVLPGEIA